MMSQKIYFGATNDGIISFIFTIEHYTVYSIQYTIHVNSIVICSSPCCVATQKFSGDWMKANTFFKFKIINGFSRAFVPVSAVLAFTTAYSVVHSAQYLLVVLWFLL